RNAAPAGHRERYRHDRRRAADRLRAPGPRQRARRDRRRDRRPRLHVLVAARQLRVGLRVPAALRAGRGRPHHLRPDAQAQRALVRRGRRRQRAGRVSATFAFGGFAIPHDLALLTGGGEDTWAGIAAAHLAAYARYCPLRPDHDVLEIGCGVGRDAIPLTGVLRGGGSYVGLDVSAPSIAWCQEHITPRHPDFRFAHLDIHSQFYNPGGVLMGDEVTLPVADRSIDRI